MANNKTKLYKTIKKLPTWISIILEIIIALLYYYVFIPPINICAFTFWTFVVFIIIEVFIIIAGIIFLFFHKWTFSDNRFIYEKY